MGQTLAGVFLHYWRRTLWKRCVKKICWGCRISDSFSALPNENICSSVTELQFPTKLKEEQ
jgi:hypothetical protein